MTTRFAALARQRLRGELLADEPLALHTSLRVGGPADVFAVPADLDDLRELMRLLAETGAAHLVIGGGYNLLVRDGGLRGVAISLKNLRGIEEHPGNLLSVGAGVKAKLIEGLTLRPEVRFHDTTIGSGYNFAGLQVSLGLGYSW